MKDEELSLKRWNLVLESRVDYHQKTVLSSNPSCVTFVKICNENVNERLSEIDFDEMVKKLKEWYFSHSDSDEVHY